MIERTEKQIHIVTLTTCHNRCVATLASLADLHDQELPGYVSMAHVLVDDGSTDETCREVNRQFPDVEIVQGDGQLYWAGGMRLGWERSVSKKAFDYLFVYNDDVRLNQAAIKELLKTLKSENGAKDLPHVIVGSFTNQDGSETTYGGRCRSSIWHPLKFAMLVEPNGWPQKADTLNMNGALISASALREVGFLSDFFIHSGADFEYGLKLTKAGGTIYVAGEHIGTCDLNRQMEPPDEFLLTLMQRLRLLMDIKREPFRQRYQYYKNHGGFFWLFLWVSPYLTVWIRHVWFALVRLSGLSGTKTGAL